MSDTSNRTVARTDEDVRGGRPEHGGPEGSGGGDGGWRWLMTARDAVEAALVRGYLEAAGVPVVLDRRDPSPGAWLFLSGNVRAPVRVMVPAALLDAARLELLEAGFAMPGAPEAEPHQAPRPPGRSRRVAVVLAAIAAITVATILVAGDIITCRLEPFC